MISSAIWKPVSWATAAVTALIFAVPANASLTFTFSGVSSDLTDPADLSATMTLTVTPLGAGLTDLLTVTLTNNTAAPAAFTISDAYWNYTGDSGAASLVSQPLSPLVSELTTDESANGFGIYDFRLNLVTAPMNDGLGPGESNSWDIDLGATGVTDSDFDLWADPIDGNPVGVGALKFAQGPCDPEITDSCVEDSAFALPSGSDGGTPPTSIVPEPLSAALVSTAVVGLVAIRRKMA